MFGLILLVLVHVLVVFAAAQEYGGIALWANGDSKPPGYALWDGSGFSPSGNMKSTGKRWRIIQGAYSPTRDEAIVIGVTDGSTADARVTAQMYSGGSWSELPFSPLDNKATNSYSVGFDVRYESQSGNAVMVWHRGTGDTILYRIWNGSSWSPEARINTPVSGGEHDALHLESSPVSNEIVLIVGVRTRSIYCMVWNGSSWGNGISLGTDGKGALKTIQVAYEQKSGRAMVVYPNSSPTLYYRIWDRSKWSPQRSVSPPRNIQQNVKRVTIGADLSSNRIAVGVIANKERALWLAVWDGINGWDSVTAATSSPSDNSDGIAVGFESTSGQALAVYTQSTNEVRYRTWSKTWSGEYIGPNLGDRPNSMTLSCSPGGNEIILSVQDNGQDANFCLWNGNTWGTVYEMTSDTGEWLNKNLPFLFLWNPTLPTIPPTPAPTFKPTVSPTPRPSPSPTKRPTMQPTRPPASPPTRTPTEAPTVNPTVSPTKSPTKLPTLAPTTAQPSPSPTLAPTSLPTRSPTKKPTQSPTPLPTKTPTAAPTAPQPSPLPTPIPSLPPTVYPTESPTKIPTSAPTALERTPVPSRVPTFPPTPTPTLFPTQAHTKLQTPAPSLMPTLSQSDQDLKAAGQEPFGTGKVCSRNLDCKSNTCRNGVCMASSECYPIKHEYGSPFDKHRINIVFVPSAFDTVAREEWHTQVNNTYQVFENFNMFSKEIEQLNVFFVDPQYLDPSFCDFGCADIDRLLCCDINRAHGLSSKCFPVGQNQQTVVIHNSPEYGGAGYSYQNIATLTVHPQAPLVAVHELGHSLFQLADEYWYGPGNAADPNCDSRRKCKKWADLVGEKNTPPGYDTVQCIPGCRNNNFYIGMKSFMEDLSKPVGAVNERFACCTYQVLTKSMPSYCDVFDSSPGYLLNYCKNNDYQDYGSSNYDVEPKIAIPGVVGKEDKHAKYVYVSDPVLVTITTRIRRNGKAIFTAEQTPLPPGIFHKSQINGDFKKPKVAAKQGLDSLLKVVVVYRTGKETLLVSQNLTIEVPLPQANDRATPQGEPRIVSEKSDVVEIVLDTRGRGIKRIRSMLIETR